jgi:formamidopyrimidine-DNA glycosylase
VPELPEVETIRRHLAPHVEGRRLERIEVLDPRWCRPLRPGDIAHAVAGRTLERLGRRGKYLVMELEDDVHLMLHLRMTGNLLIERQSHTRVRFHFEGRELFYDDPRRFGTGELALGAEQRDAFFAARLGLEPFDPEFTPGHLQTLARGSRAPIKAFLLDQKRIAGVGNIYADEALFRARVHPLRAAGKLTRKQWEAIHRGVIESLEAGIAAKGATIDDFRHPDGVYGSFQNQFLIHLREGEDCDECGFTIRKLRAAGRGTYVCERCQPRPRGAAQAAAASSRRSPAASARASS